MARFQIQPNSSAGQTVPPQAILQADANDCPRCVLVQNVGASTIWFSENQSSLAQVDQNNNPVDGFVLQPNQIQHISTVRGALYATSLNGGLVNCTGWKK